MAIERLPEGVRTPAVARAATSPGAVVATGAGVAVGLLAGLPGFAIVLLGAGGWGIRMAFAAAASARRRRATRPEPIDPYALPEPWRGYVKEAVAAQTRFAEAARRARPGPLHDHLTLMTARMGEAVQECWRTAHLGASIAAALAALDPDATSRRLRQVQAGRQQQATPGGPSPAAIDETEAALAARLQSARRMQTVVQRTADRLQVLTAQLGEAVAAAVELSLEAGETAAAAPIAGSVDAVVAEMQALRQATEEAEGAEGAAPTGSAPSP